MFVIEIVRERTRDYYEIVRNFFKNLRVERGPKCHLGQACENYVSTRELDS